MFGLSENRIAWWNSEDEDISVVNVNGPIQDAYMSDGSWMITGWRQDLRWSKSQFHSQPDSGVSRNWIQNRGQGG